MQTFRYKCPPFSRIGTKKKKEEGKGKGQAGDGLTLTGLSPGMVAIGYSGYESHDEGKTDEDPPAVVLSNFGC